MLDADMKEIVRVAIKSVTGPLPLTSDEEWLYVMDSVDLIMLIEDDLKFGVRFLDANGVEFTSVKDILIAVEQKKVHMRVPGDLEKLLFSVFKERTQKLLLKLFIDEGFPSSRRNCLMKEEIQRALDGGTKCFSVRGDPLFSVDSVIEALQRDGEIRGEQ